MRLIPALFALTFSLAVAQPRQPDVAAQKAAMKKLDFLVGKWEGEAKLLRGPGEPLTVRQNEDVQVKLDGLALLVEGTGRDPQSGKVVFQAMATISFDDATGVYKLRSHSDGRYLDTELKVDEKGYGWGFDAGPAKVRYTMTLNAQGAWVETGEVTVGGGQPRKMMDMTVRRIQ